ncbi:unnamed protein product [Microthlaspi erraticum]|uniref:NYN domain-containing protein n=1 Tax=Microthlaspi erraticum TaxID=1685480 RepID=A0A6D2L919_9BRAS|nr:unnamed protein product [Microthlaspi erraticum]CAA7062381.1 unnamed protein product [Microthlaspi erraticum]
MTAGTLTSEVAEAETIVIWDIEGCPIPDGLNPSMVSQNIKTALVNAGYHGAVSINAVADDTTSHVTADEFESAGVKLTLVPEGMKGKAHARARAMLLNVLMGWIFKHQESTNVMFISNFIRSFGVGSYASTRLNVLVSQPQIPSPELVCDVGDARSIWSWENLSAGGNPYEQSFLGVDTCHCCGVRITQEVLLRH